MRGRSTTFLGLFLLAGCSADLVWLDPNEAVTVLTVLVRPGARPEVVAFDLRGSPQSFEVTDRDRAQLYLLRFDQSVESLELAAGAQVLGEFGLGLDQASSVGFIDLSAGETSLTELSELPADLASLHLRGNAPSPCVSLEFEFLEVPGLAGATPTYLIALAPSRVLLGTNRGVFAIDDLGAVPQAISSTLPHDAAFFHEASDELWLFAQDGTVVHGHPDRGFVRAPDRPVHVPGDLEADGSRGDAPLEIYVATSSPSLERFDGRSWTILPDARPSAAADRDRTKLAWVGPGGVAAIGWGDARAVVWDQGEITVQDLGLPGTPVGDRDALYELDYVEGIGAVIGTRYARLYTLSDRQPPSWNILPISSLTPRTEFIVPFGEGLLTGGEGGVLIQYVAPRGNYCDTQSIPIEPWRVVPFQDGFLAVGNPIKQSVSVMGIFRPGP